jgi:hypothetical protein
MYNMVSYASNTMLLYSFQTVESRTHAKRGAYSCNPTVVLQDPNVEIPAIEIENLSQVPYTARVNNLHGVDGDQDHLSTPICPVALESCGGALA